MPRPDPARTSIMGGELFKLMSGTDILHVAYKGSDRRAQRHHRRPRAHDVRRGPVVGPNVLAGQVRALGVTGAKRSPCCRTCRPSRRPACRATSTPAGPASWRRPERRSRSSICSTPRSASSRQPEVKALWDEAGRRDDVDDAGRVDAHLRADIEKWTQGREGRRCIKINERYAGSRREREMGGTDDCPSCRLGLPRRADRPRLAGRSPKPTPPARSP